MHSGTALVNQLVTRARQATQHSVQRAVRQAVVGQADPVIAVTDGSSWHGNDSMSARVHAHSSMFVAGLRALLLQTLHPLAMAGVAQHSDYRNDPWGRLQRTARYIAVTTYRPRAEAQLAIDQVRAVHERITGTASDGRRYAATDPELLLWVHATEVDSFLRSYQRYGRNRLSHDQADRYVAEMAEFGVALGVNARDVPTTFAQLRQYLATVDGLRVSTEAQQAVRFLLLPPVATSLAPSYAVIALGAIELLPWWARVELNLLLPPGLDRLIARPTSGLLLNVLQWSKPIPSSASKDGDVDDDTSSTSTQSG